MTTNSLLRKLLPVAVAAASVAGLAAAAAPADAAPARVAVPAVDSNCRKVTMSDNDLITKYIPVAGWGWTNWRVMPTITAWDRCDHGGLNVLISLNDATVRAKGGQLRVSSVSYQTSSSSAWRPMYLISSWPSFEYGDGGHVDLSRTTRITKVRIVTAVWTRQDGSGWVGIASDTEVCNLLTGSCS